MSTTSSQFSSYSESDKSNGLNDKKLNIENLKGNVGISYFFKFVVIGGLILIFLVLVVLFIIVVIKVTSVPKTEYFDYKYTIKEYNNITNGYVSIYEKGSKLGFCYKNEICFILSKYYNPYPYDIPNKMELNNENKKFLSDNF